MGVIMLLADFDAAFERIVDSGGDRNSPETRALVRRASPDPKVRGYLLFRCRQLASGAIAFTQPAPAPTTKEPSPEWIADQQRRAGLPPTQPAATAATTMKDVTPMTEPKLTYQQNLSSNIKVLKGLGLSYEQAYSRCLGLSGAVKLTDAEVDQIAIKLLMKEGKTLDEATSILMTDRENNARAVLKRIA